MEAVLTIIRNNVSMAKSIIRQAVLRIREERTCPCVSALQFAIISDKRIIPVETQENLRIIIGKYLQ